MAAHCEKGSPIHILFKHFNSERLSQNTTFVVSEYRPMGGGDCYILLSLQLTPTMLTQTKGEGHYLSQGKVVIIEFFFRQNRINIRMKHGAQTGDARGKEYSW
ncbi:hypothetical protein ACET9B_11550 [Aeromonas veronii]|uniref:hypothetical protein n=1 Tax=Aeromonas TaxID=642 RepID=UPI001C21E02C|nr:MULTISPECIES: hypothetical protein [Aeromonas]QXB28893.1 hypothetical protein I6L35_16540 [Aeromonas sp. FDAARGOS 1405]UPK53739.1 hypothetical protein MYF86_14735 [Aeromonas veronii]